MTLNKETFHILLEKKESVWKRFHLPSNLYKHSNMKLLSPNKRFVASPKI